MRHLKKNSKKFKRTDEERRRLAKDLITALALNGNIVTFTARAKWFRPKFDRLITLVKNSEGNTKLAYTKIRPFVSEKVARKLIEEIVPTLLDRQGGYTMQIKLFQEFSPHDKSIVKIVEGTAPKTSQVQAITEELSAPTDATITDVVVNKKPAKKPTAKTTTKKATPKQV